MASKLQSPGFIVTDVPEIVPFGIWATRFEKEYCDGSGHSARARRNDLRALREFLFSITPKVDRLSVYQLTPTLAARSVSHSLDIGKAPATVARRLTTWTHLGTFLESRVRGFTNPWRGLKPPKPPRPSTKRWLSPEELATLLMSLPTATDYRSVLVRSSVLILLGSGLRSFELLGLTEAQIGPGMRFFLDVRRKGNKFQHIAIPASVRPALGMLLEARREFVADWCRRKRRPLPDLVQYPLLIGPRVVKTPQAMSYKTLYRMIDEVCVRAGIRHVGVHSTRHTFAKRLLDSTKDLVLVAQALGHSSVQTTMGYTESTDEGILQAVDHMLEDSNDPSFSLRSRHS